MNSNKTGITRREKLSSSTIIGIAATVIALASLLLTAWAGYQTRLHDRLSVKPFLLRINNFVDGEPEYGILLCNKGIGPAIVKELRLFVDGKPVASDQYGGWGNARSQLGISGAWNHCAGSSYCALSAGETLPLLAIKAKDQNEGRSLRLREAIARLDIVIVYESIYGERFTEPPETGVSNCRAFF